MPTTVIDQLIVTLGLDPSNYRKGSREAEKQLDTTRRKVVATSNEMGKAVTTAARQFALAFVGFSTATGFTRMLTGLNETARRLGLMAKNTTNSAADLRNWSNAAEVAGGSAEGLLSTITAIQREQSSFQLTGESGWIGYLRQLGVSLLDVNGEAKPHMQILRELSVAYERIAATQGRAKANSIGLAMGIDQGTMNFLLRGPQGIDALIEQQKELPQLTDASAEAAGRLNASWVLLKQRGAALLLVLLEQLQPHLERVFAWLSKISTEGVQSGRWAEGIVTGVETIANAVERLLGLLDRVTGRLETVSNSGIGRVLGLGGSKRDADHPYASTSEDSALLADAWYWLRDKARGKKGIRNNNPGNLRFAGQNGAVDDGTGFAKFATMAEGIQAASKQLDLYASRGINTIASVVRTWAPPGENDTEAYTKAVARYMNKNPNDPLTAGERQALLQGMFNQENGYNAVTGASVAAAMAAPGAGGRGTVINNTTQIEKITINTQATDAGGIANSLERSLQRKNTSAHADYGLQ